MYDTQVLETGTGFKLQISYEGKVVYESGTKKDPEQARAQSLSFIYRGPNVQSGGQGDGNGNGKRRKPRPYVVSDDQGMY